MIYQDTYIEIVHLGNVAYRIYYVQVKRYKISVEVR
jgi:hypothetical protein